MNSERILQVYQSNLENLLEAKDKVYQVPPYQRTYEWEREQWEKLFEDVTKLEENQAHFFGSIVVVWLEPVPRGVNYFQLVDGQQRIATLLIWLSVIRDMAKEKGNNELVKKLEEMFFVSGSEGDEPKLQLGELDKDAFEIILKGNYKEKEKEYQNHLIFKCYKYFKYKTEEILKEKSENVNLLEELVDKILNKIHIVDIYPKNLFNAYRLFEILNDRGLELSAVDLIKNFVLMKVASDKNILKNTIEEWNEMYGKVKDHEPVKFLRRFILSEWKGNIPETQLYKKVTDLLEKEKDPQKFYEFVKSLNSSATIYKKISECKTSSSNVNNKLEDLHSVEVSPSFTLLLKVIHYMEEKKIPEEDVLEILDMIETFHIRWGICELTTWKLDGIYNEICMSLKDVNDPKKFKEVIKQKFSEEIKNNADDGIFKSRFHSKNFKGDEKRTKYILWKLCGPTGEVTLNIKEINTEHIMPQTLSEEWIEDLKKKTSKSKEEIITLHKQNVNRIGNLTIIKGEWNRSMSNKLFDEKKEEYYVKSEFEITKELCSYQKWTFEEIEKRTNFLLDKALEIWRWRWG